MIPPRTTGGNVPQGRVNCQTRGARAAWAACMEKIYEIPRACAAGAMRQFSFIELDSSVVNQVPVLESVDDTKFSYYPQLY
jgi:hypothetical protein